MFLTSVLRFFIKKIPKNYSLPADYNNLINSFYHFYPIPQIWEIYKLTKKITHKLQRLNDKTLCFLSSKDTSVDNEIQYVRQSGITVEVIDQGQMLTKPIKSRIILTHDDFLITTNFYDPYTVSDVTPVNGPGSWIRNILVNDYYIGNWLTTYGIFYVVVDDDVIVRQSGLYFTPETVGRCDSVLVEKGNMWKL